MLDKPHTCKVAKSNLITNEQRGKFLNIRNCGAESVGSITR